MTHRLLLLAWCCVLAVGMQAQTDDDWENTWRELDEQTDDEDLTDEDTYELLQQLAEHPIDLNRCDREDLEQLPFLSAQQVMDIVAYRQRYGPLRSLGELRMIRSMDYRQLQLLPYFVVAGEAPDSTHHFPRLATIGRYGRHKLTVAARVPFYERKGDRNGYLGYRYRHWLHYEFGYGDYVRAGLVGAQDAGEPFFKGGNGWGYDAYSYYAQIRKWKTIDNLVVGKYKLSTGLGLVLNNSFALGKLATLQNLGRRQHSLRPHASRSVADYFQGAAATLHLGRPLQLTLFGSYRPVDATLGDDGSIATIVTNGYHRTPTEMEKKHNAHQTAAGFSLGYQGGGLHAGVNGTFTHLDRRLSPNTKTLYRRHYAQGRNFVNVSLNYGYTRYRLSLNGETAIDGHGGMATLNALSYQPSGQLSLVALQRFYGYRYTTLHGHAFSEGGHVQNESGFYLGGTWQPLYGLSLSGYADVAYFPWARYRVSQSSWAQDYLAEVAYQRKAWTLKGRYRARLRQQDNEKKTALRRHNEHRARLTLGYKPDEHWASTTRWDGVRTADNDIEKGWMISENLTWKQQWWMLGLTATYFDTDSYSSRIYAFESPLPGEFSFPSFYGKGMRLVFSGRASIGQRLQLHARLGHTRYFDRDVIGSGLQQIEGKSTTDLDLQARWRF